MKITPEGEASLFAKTPDRIGNGHIVIVNKVMYITGFHGHRIYQVTMDGEVSILAGTGERGSIDGPALNATFSYPNGIAYDPGDHTLYINERHRDQNVANLTPAKSSIRAIKLARISDSIKKEIDTNGLKNAISVYKALKKLEKFKDVDTESDINDLGHDYLYVGKHDEATAVFEMNIDSYPDRVLAYAFMARNMYIANRPNEAIKFYKKALKLMPESKTLKSRLEQVQEYMNEKP